MFRVNLISCLSACSMVLFSSCTSSSSGSQSQIPVAPEKDDKYAPVLEKWQRQVRVFNQLQTQADSFAVLLTDEFRRAYVDRWKMIRGDVKTNFDDMTAGKLGIVISFYTPEYPYTFLDNSKVWSHELKYGDKSFAPVAVKFLNDKTLLNPYFPFANRWSKEFLVVFDTATPGNEAMVLPTSVSYAVRSALVNLEFVWK